MASATLTPRMTPAQVAEQLLTARTVADIERVVESVPEPVWMPLGGRRANAAQLGVFADSADALIERVTNGMDAEIEREVLLREQGEFSNPRQAVEALFGIPGGHIADVADNRTPAHRELASQIVLTLRDSGDDKRPTVQVFDHGVGQHPSDFARTLVSLNEDNKRTRLYLLGAYGWGGAASFSFAAYVAFLSRRNPRLLGAGLPDTVGWTIVRYNPLDEDIFSKHGLYEYLCVKGEDSPEVPVLLPSHLPSHLRSWSGTACTMVSYELSRYAEPAWRANHSAWLMFNAFLFDPVLPFLVRDERPKAIKGNEKSSLGGLVINGTAARLAWDSTKRKDDVRRIEYQNAYLADLGDSGTATIRYSVLREKGDSKKDWEPTETYVTADQAVTITHNGQRQGTWRRELFAQLGLLTLSKFMIVQVDCDRLSWKAKRELFATTRDRLKDSPLARQLREKVAEALASDTQLRGLDRRRKDMALSRRADEHAARIRKMLAKAIEASRQGEQETFHKVISSNPELPLFADQPIVQPEPAEPSEAQEEPAVPTARPEYSGEPTDLRVINPKVRVPAGGKAVVKLWMDAPDGYISPAKGAGHFSGLVTRGNSEFGIAGYSELRGGFLRCTLSAANAAVGSRGRVVFTVTKSDGLPLVDEAELEAVEPPMARVRTSDRARPGKEDTGPNVEDVHREDWDTFDLDEKRVARVEANSGGRGLTTIYVNWDYPPLDAKLRAERKVDEDQIAQYKRKFCAAMALAAWLQEEGQGEAALNEEARFTELRRAATVFLFTEFVRDRS